ncbi:MAG: hypothetical protein ACKOYM_07065 [Actinomycetes bacterium]
MPPRCDRNPNQLDLLAQDYLPDWEIDRPSAERLCGICEVVADQIVRPSRARISSPIVAVAGNQLREDRDLIRRMTRSFVTALTTGLPAELRYCATLIERLQAAVQRGGTTGR